MTMEVFAAKTDIRMLSNFAKQEKIVLGEHSAAFMRSEACSIATPNLLFTKGCPDVDRSKSELVGIAGQLVQE
jgi:hypothetical protein